MLVLKTLPGNAHSLGALIDHLEWDEIIGTICGDDTCLICVHLTIQVLSLIVS